MNRPANKTKLIRKVSNALKNNAVFSGLDSEVRSKFAAFFEELTFAEGEDVIKKGEPCDSFYIVESGIAEIYLADENGKDQIVNILQREDHFGEQAFQDKDTVRSASVRGRKGGLRCFRITKEDIMKLTLPAVAKERLAATFQLRRRVGNKILAKKVVSKSKKGKGRTNIEHDAAPIQKKDQKTREILKKALTEKSDVAKLMHSMSTDKVVDRMWKIVCKPNEVIVEQGATGAHMFVIVSGEFEVTVGDEQVDYLTPGCLFGELALLYETTRNATVTAISTPGEYILYAIDRTSYRTILDHCYKERISKYEKFVSQVPLLKSLLPYEHRQIAEAIEEVRFAEGETIIKIGDPGDRFFIVVHGTAIVKIRDEQTGELKPIKKLSDGDSFGERALLGSDVRTATIVATGGPVFCVTLDSESFSSLLGPLEEVIKKRTGGYSDKYEHEDEVYDDRKMSDYEEEFYKQSSEVLDKSIKKKDLKIIGMCGRGSYGSVYLVEHRTTKKLYALKEVSKDLISKLGHENHIMNERRVSGRLNSQFLVQLITTYREKSKLYFLQEVMLGGELFSLLRKHVVFPNQVARYYAASAILGLDYMHSKNILYRDLKPENLLLNSHGHLKLADFGFAKITKSQSFTLCGTPCYLAPEMVSGEGHGRALDWWCIGILIYEMLCSFPPFLGKTPMETYKFILKGKIHFPDFITPAAKDIIRRFLRKRPHKRYGVGKDGIKTIMEHPWFYGFDWKALKNGTMEPPLIPEVSMDEFAQVLKKAKAQDQVPKHTILESDIDTDWDHGF